MCGSRRAGRQASAVGYYQQDVTTDRFEDLRRREGGDGPWLKKFRRKRIKGPFKPSEPRVKDFLDLIAPHSLEVQHGPLHLRRDLPLHPGPGATPPAPRSWLCSAAWEKSGVTLHIYNRKVSVAEEDKIIHNAENKNKLDRGSTSSMKQAVTAEANLQDVAALIASMRKNSEPLIHCAVFIGALRQRPGQSARPAG